MHFSFVTALSAASLVTGAAITKRQSLADDSVPATSLFPALPVSLFEKTAGHTLTLEEALAGLNISDKVKDAIEDWLTPNLKSRATCSSVRVRQEWDSYSTSDRQNWVDSLKCLMKKAPSGQFPASKSRYEDFTALHQILTPNVHQSAKFLLWHRYYLWTFEQVLRDECGFTAPLPWFDETKYAGKFSQSSIFSSQWLGAISLGGACVTDGVSESRLTTLRTKLLTLFPAIRQHRHQRRPRFR
jgi:tyrosinase